MQLLDENPVVRVSLVEITNEFNYSNPTAFFNISIPHIDLRTSMYQTLNYIYFKKMAMQAQYNAAAVAESQGSKGSKEEKKDGYTPDEEEGKNP